MGIKYIIVIADNPVRKQAHIQAHLKRTDLMLFRIFLYTFPGKAVPVGKQIINCIIDTVKMAFCIRTMLRITDTFLLKADLFLSRKDHAFKAEPLCSQKIQSLLGNRSGDRLCCQVE